MFDNRRLRDVLNVVDTAICISEDLKNEAWTTEAHLHVSCRGEVYALDHWNLSVRW